ncbi:DNA replication and repair protein RecF [Halolactibacillus alkaliphilus]|uniref:DNA replication and repair protein RecF n=1 Tax=Halolactibacillus alkaliphilus TaxID=442899 RepID=A0A511X0D0_9BACI|nr:DNA replication/repair protein RecF [Halolactibacillus alkaliphilus]GEN56403.1 DNA replication and repair protein RecF [Halolactibacillus alkaliphilus]GGN64610.1 DNA replication and repair protein RecF [Halolactibacillus alkaliphilus]SFO60748.1 DNA replication and repair protein RecF [Halolactibacillus alkaliphilus]
MYIEHITLTHYRNYPSLTLEFDPKVNVIIGENAQGKTNLMEAIYVLAFTKSYRTSKDKELVMWDESYAKIEGTVFKRNYHIPMEMQFQSKGKTAKLNHLEQKRLSHYIGALNVVMFAPEDLNLVKGSPQVRRRFIDMEIGQVKPVYIYHLGQYQKILKQRNHLLKDLQRRKTTDITMLEVLTDQLITHASEILIRRFLFLDLLLKWARPIHQGITQNKETLTIDYDTSIEVEKTAPIETIKQIYQETFKHNQQKEIDRGTTLYGPHRDDLIFYVNGRNVQTFGSQGQQRTTALSLKLAEIELIKNEVGEYPVLLLDDVLSELDRHRQSHLLNTIKDKVQTFVTTTSVNDIEHQTIQTATIFHVDNGQVICEERREH